MKVKFVFKNTRIPSLNRLIELAKEKKRTRKSRKTHKVTTYTALDKLKETLNRELGTSALHQHSGGVICTKHSVIFRHYVKDVNLTDPDNIEVRQKFIFDAMVNAGILLDDNYSILGGGKFHIIKQDKGRPRIELFILDVNLIPMVESLLKKHF